MEWLSENWVFLLALVAMVAMHLFGHGSYGLTNPAGGHMREFLTIALPGFEWLTPKGFAIGLAKSFLYGALAGLVYVPIYNAFARRFGT